jgi:hypothetical protein
MSTILLIILILFLVGALPTWPYSANWGYGPSGWAKLGPPGIACSHRLIVDVASGECLVYLLMFLKTEQF